MPIEIRELQIRVTINESQASAGPQVGSAGESVDVRGLVKECIEHVTEIINSKKER